MLTSTIPGAGSKFDRLMKALDEIGRPAHPSWPAARIAAHIRAALGPIPHGMRAEDFADIALHRIAQGDLAPDWHRTVNHSSSQIGTRRFSMQRITREIGAFANVAD